MSYRGGETASVSRDVVVQDWLIVAIGDSYGSGEGSPDIPISLDLLNETRAALEDLQDALRELEDHLKELTALREVRDQAKQAWDAAKAAASNALQRLRSAQISFDNVFNKVERCRSAARRWRDRCLKFPPSTSCPGATSDLITCLVDCGVSSERTLLTRGFNAVMNLLDGLVADARDLLDVAREAYDVAQALANTREDAYNAAAAAFSAGVTAVDLARAVADDSRGLYHDLESQLRATWQDTRCHRSANSSQARAALQIEDSDPRTSVTFVHIACSGAQIDKGLVGSYRGVEPVAGETLDPQIDQVRDLIGDREIDALLISIGGNDVNFGEMIKTCVKQEDCHLSRRLDNTAQAAVAAACAGMFSDECVQALTSNVSSESARELFESGMSDLSDGYDSLEEMIGNRSARPPRSARLRDRIPERLAASPERRARSTRESRPETSRASPAASGRGSAGA